ncbi:MAG: VOC family protein [Actinomycetota bacterium]
MLKLGNVMLGSDEPEKLVEFYKKVLGEPAFSDGGFTGWTTTGAMLMVGGHSEVKGRNEMPGRLIFFFETNDVQAEFNRVKGLGATVVHEPYHPGPEEITLATFEDPDGNYFQISSPPPKM